jgi:hypothetical protein
MNEEKDLSDGKQLVHADDLTKAQVNEICADLLAKAEALLEKAEELRRYRESLPPEELEIADEWAEADRTEQELRDATLGHVEHVRELREYWASKHYELTL